VKKYIMLIVLAAVLLLAIPASAVLADYQTNMGWTTSNGGILVLSPAVGSGPDVTITFTCDRGFGLGNVAEGMDDTMTGIGYHYGDYGQNATVTFTFSHDVEDVKLNIYDLDTFEGLMSMSPIPDDVYNEFGYLYISGNTVQASAANAHGDLIYDEVLSSQTISLTFKQSYSDLGLVNLQFSVIPEPATLCLLGLGGVLLRKRKV
jgi:PEP-CTERM motif